MSDVDKLEQNWRTLEADAQRIMAEKDAAIDAIRAQYTDQLRSQRSGRRCAEGVPRCSVRELPCSIAPMGGRR
jgi:hypothetical protein